jgi:L,D-transpeptidase catalytic domain/Putative peptidoglycan binding domain
MFLETRKSMQSQNEYPARIGRVRFKYLFSVCLLLISTPSILTAQQRGKLTRTETMEAERRLSEMGYWIDVVDGLFDPAIRSALVAFQKWEGRPITGRLTLDELEAMRISTAPKARELGYEHVEVDLDRQVLLMVSDKDDVRVLPVSTGTGNTFMDEGQTSIAYTPRGRFVVYQKDVGWQSGSLGSTYYANFISGGVAIHGSRSVPVQPASHGCIRVPMFAARDVSKLMPVGTIVLVYDKVSFVSAKSWAENPRLRQAVLLSALANDTEPANEIKTKSGSLAIRKARSKTIRAGLRLNNPGDFLLSHTVSHAVPSAPAGLTSVFGMGTGVTLPTKSPENFFGSGDPAGVLKNPKARGTSWGQSPRYGTFEISDLRSEISEIE